MKIAPAIAASSLWVFLVSGCDHLDTGELPEAQLASSFVVGIADSSAVMFDNAGFDAFFTRTNGQPNARAAQTYVRWDIATCSACDPERAELQAWLDGAAAHHVEAMVTFRSPPDHTYPTAGQFEAEFQQFRQRWPAVKTFTAWNEPNGLLARTARTAADYYLAARRNCAPGDGCRVAAGNMLLEMPERPLSEVATADPANPCASASCSWLDRYKASIELDSAEYGLPHHRPEVWAVHNWGDAHEYQEASDHCGRSTTCFLRAFLHSLGGSWSSTEVWVTELGAEAAGPHLRSSPFTQACGGAFFLRLVGVDPRIKRLYYYNFEGGSSDNGLCPWATHDSGACFDSSGHSARPIFDVLRDRRQSYSANCP